MLTLCVALAGFSGAAAAETAGPLPMAAFTPPPDATAPAGALEGRLTVAFGRRPDGVSVLRDDAPPAGADHRLAWPVLEVDLAQDGDRLVPSVARRAGTERGDWDWSVGPGQAWPGPQGVVAVLPVALRELNANCVHNGHLRLTIAPDGGVRTTWVQIGAETCLYYKFDAWTAAKARLVRQSVSDRDSLIRRDRENRAAQAPVAPLAKLAATDPGLDLQGLANAAGDDEAVYGLVVDGVNYVAPCPTRYGEDPFCDGRELPSYSTAKSLVGGLGLMRLERLQPGLAARSLESLVRDCRASEPWTDVTLLNLLDMATGRYRSAANQADEDAPGTLPFFLSKTHTEKLAFACRGYPRRAAPGTAWVYHTSDSYLLGAALTEALREAEGGDLYDDVLRPVWRELRLSPALDETRRTQDASAQPFVGWGVFLRRDDAARLGMFLSPAGRAEQDRLFDAMLIGQALQRPGLEGGLPAGSSKLRYTHGFWARDISDLLGCPRPVWTPFLSGYGGISIVLFPNGVVFYAFGDAGRFDWGPAAAAANTVRALCHD